MKCPGQDMQFWKEEAIFEVPCASCGHSIEFYKDDTNRKCASCGNRMVNPRMDFGCAAYCQFAEQCLGTLPEEFVGQQDNLLKDRVAVEVKRNLKSDFRRIGRIMRQARYAEQLARDEGANLGITLCTVYLLEIGEVEAIAILDKLSANKQLIKEVCALIQTCQRCNQVETTEQQVLADATLLAEIEEIYKKTGMGNDSLALQGYVQQLKTTGGRRQAQKLLGQ